MPRIKTLKCDYYEIHLVNEEGGNRDNQINYVNLLESFPREYGSITEEQYGNSEARFAIINEGNYCIKLDKINGQALTDRNNDIDRFLKFQFVKLNTTDASQAMDNRPGTMQLELDTDTYIADGTVLVIDTHNNRAIFYMNGKACRISRIEEYINHFWHSHQNRNTSFKFYQIQDDPEEFLQNVHHGHLRYKKIELKGLQRIANIPDGDPMADSMNAFSDFGGYTINVTISKGRSNEFINGESVGRLADFALDENRADILQKAKISYLDEDDNPSIIDLMKTSKRAYLDMEVDDDAFIGLDDIENQLTRQYLTDYPER